MPINLFSIIFLEKVAFTEKLNFVFELYQPLILLYTFSIELFRSMVHMLKILIPIIPTILLLPRNRTEIKQ